jgi:CRP/FNR family transcriptional regulator
MDDGTRSALRAIPILAELDEDALAELAERTTEFDAPAGSVLVEVGQPGAGLFLLEEGEVEVDVPDRRVVILAPGSFFGEAALLTDRPRNARVRARTAVRCRALSRIDFERALERYPQIALAMLRALAERMSDPG